MDIGVVGFGIIAIFVLSWGLSSLIHRLNRYDDLDVARPSSDAVHAIATEQPATAEETIIA